MSAPGSYTRPGQYDLVNQPINMLIHSDPGEGKTVFWGSGKEKVLIMRSDPEGTISAVNVHGPHFHEVEAIDYDDLEDIYDWLKGDRPDDFNWIVWDSLTLFQHATLIDYIMPEAVSNNPNQDEFVPSQREYLQSINRISKFVRLFANLPYNFGISTHTEMGRDPQGGDRMLMPDVQGKKMPQRVAGYMNVVGYMDKGPSKADEKKVVQRIRWQKAPLIYAKDRWGALGTVMERPTLPNCEKLIEDRRAEMIAAREAPTPRANNVKPEKKMSPVDRARAAARAAKAN